ncbi:hypothetical protein GQ54DRAFT_288652 [Martensiomyces pterosporus]|nr:hypothetical protein GQ54DRAFT_288652 [Martensiomyces pterosporus]
MEPIPVPDSRQPHCNIYATRGALESQNLVVIVTGHGVRAGVWAWNVLVKQGLRAGSVIEYIKDCVNRGFGVLVLNPNENIVAPDGLPETFNSYTGKSLPISGSETPNEHVGYVWRHIIRDSKAESVTFVAYNTAGIAVADLLQYDFERFAAKVSGVAFIDSLHSTFQMQSIHVKWLEMAAKQWITSADPAGEQVSSGSVGCVTVSAGNDTDYRELTPFVCKTLVIDYISDCFDRGQIVSTSDSLDAGGQFEAGTGMDPTPDDDGGAFGGAGGLESVQMVQDIHSFDGDGYIGWE